MSTIVINGARIETDYAPFVTVRPDGTVVLSSAPQDSAPAPTKRPSAKTVPEALHTIPALEDAPADTDGVRHIAFRARKWTDLPDICQMVWATLLPGAWLSKRAVCLRCGFDSADRVNRDLSHKVEYVIRRLLAERLVVYRTWGGSRERPRYHYATRMWGKAHPNENAPPEELPS